MRINFPKMHIAQSVTNRILNFADGVALSSPGPTGGVAPVGNLEQQSAQLDQALSQPVPEMPAADPATEQAILLDKII